jgi:hypothetical protein
MVLIHGLTIPPSLIRSRIRAEFERHRYVEDPAVLDILIQKNRQSFQEIMNAWSQESHILGVLLKDKSKEPKTFLQKFYEGTVLLDCSTCTCLLTELQVGMRKLSSSRLHRRVILNRFRLILHHSILDTFVSSSRGRSPWVSMPERSPLPFGRHDEPSFNLKDNEYLPTESVIRVRPWFVWIRDQNERTWIGE